MHSIVDINNDEIVFDSGYVMRSDHHSDCCESHWLDFSQVSMDDVDGLLFDLDSDTFFERVPDAGIRLIPTNGLPVFIPGYADNNGFYSDNLYLVIDKNGIHAEWDVRECQQDY